MSRDTIDRDKLVECASERESRSRQVETETCVPTSQDTLCFATQCVSRHSLETLSEDTVLRHCLKTLRVSLSTKVCLEPRSGVESLNTTSILSTLDQSRDKLIERTPPPGGGFLLNMFPHQKPCVRRPPSKILVQILRGGSSYTRFL